MMKILLGSNSPRRKELLAQLGFDFKVVGINCDEHYPNELPAQEVAEYLAALKSSAYNTLDTNEVLITSDTVVVIDDKVLGKPKDESEAKLMLRKLSRNSHFVYTSVCLRTTEKSVVFTDVAEVTVEAISDEEIMQYLQNEKPMDKAGSYGIQDWFGLSKVSKIKGSYYTIMGLPTHLVYRELMKIIG